MAAATRPRYATWLTTSPEQFSVINGNVTRVSLGVRSAPDPDKALHFFPDFPPVFPLSPPPHRITNVLSTAPYRRRAGSMPLSSRLPDGLLLHIHPWEHDLCRYLFSKSLSNRYICKEEINNCMYSFHVISLRGSCWWEKCKWLICLFDK